MADTNGTPTTNHNGQPQIPSLPPGYMAVNRADFDATIMNALLFSRQQFQRLLDPRRNLAEECGYPDDTLNVDIETYRQLYDRECIATRVVQVFPKESWQVTPLIYEDEDSEEATEFEQAWDDLEVSLAGGNSYHQDEQGGTVYEYLQRVDILSGIGHFGVLLLGIDDGKNLQDPVDGLIALNRKAVPVTNAQGKQVGWRIPKAANKRQIIDDSPLTANEDKALKEMVEKGTYNYTRKKWQKTEDGVQQITENVSHPANFLNSYLPSPLTANDRADGKTRYQGQTYDPQKFPNGPVTGTPKMCPPQGSPNDPFPDDGLGDPEDFGEISPHKKKPMRSDGGGSKVVDNVNPEGCNQYKSCGSKSQYKEVSDAQVRVIPDNGLKPTARPKFHRGDMGDAITAAVRMSAHHELPIYMHGNARGMIVTTDEPTLPKGHSLTKFEATHDGENYTVRRTQLTVNELTDNDAWGATSGGGGERGKVGLEGTDAQYAWQGAATPASLSGTDQQYFGVQFGPSEQMPDKPLKGDKKLLFIRPFDESLVQIVRYEWNIRNPRFGQPVMYRITLNDPREQHSGVGLPLATVFVHWSRVIHIADNLHSSEIFGVPRMRPVLNRLLDLRKLYGGSAEMYWRGAFPGLSLETHPQLGGDVQLNMTPGVPGNIPDMMENWSNGLQRYLALMGMSAKMLSPTVVDPTQQITVQLEAVCIQLGVPVRVFKGSERGELASSQDDASWNDRLRARQHGYITPRIIVPFVDRLIMLGVLPEPEGYSVEWPDLDSLSDIDKAAIALQQTQALGAYISGQVEQVMAPMDFLTRVMNFTEEEAEEIVKNSEEHVQDKQDEAAKLAEEQGMEPIPPDGFQSPEETQPVAVEPGQKLVHPQTGKTIAEGKEQKFPNLHAPAPAPGGVAAPGGMKPPGGAPGQKPQKTKPAFAGKPPQGGQQPKKDSGTTPPVKSQ